MRFVRFCGHFHNDKFVYIFAYMAFGTVNWDDHCMFVIKSMIYELDGDFGNCLKWLSTSFKQFVGENIAWDGHKQKNN